MTWVLIGVVAGSLVVSGHDTKEACMGREAMLREQKIPATCVRAPSFSSGLITISPSFTCCNTISCGNPC